MKESRIETALVRGVKRGFPGAEVRKLVWLGRRHAPDRVVFWPDGKIDFIELKAPGKKPHAGQRREHERLRKLGHRVWVIGTLELVNDYLLATTGLSHVHK